MNKDNIAKQKKEYYQQNKDKIDKQQGEYRKQNKDSIEAYNRERYYQNKDKKKEWYQQKKDRLTSKRIFRKYGLTQIDIDFMLKKQKNRCKICGISFNQDFHIDHNHKTNKVRGLLCRKCNIGLGNFRDNPLILAKTIKYLQEN